MTEAEYIDATNLARIRIAINAIHDCTFTSCGYSRAVALRELQLLSDELENRVRDSIVEETRS